MTARHEDRYAGPAPAARSARPHAPLTRAGRTSRQPAALGRGAPIRASRQVTLGFSGRWCHSGTTVRGQRSSTLIILGIILVLIGWLASISILTTIGIILIVVGLVLALLGSMGRAVGGRKHWY